MPKGGFPAAMDVMVEPGLVLKTLALESYWDVILVILGAASHCFFGTLEGQNLDVRCRSSERASLELFISCPALLS
jgi:hypothetical protein